MFFAMFCAFDTNWTSARFGVHQPKNGPVFKPPVSVADRSKAVIQLVYLRSVCFVSYVLFCAVIIVCVYVCPPPSASSPYF